MWKESLQFFAGKNVKKETRAKKTKTNTTIDKLPEKIIPNDQLATKQTYPAERGWERAGAIHAQKPEIGICKSR